MHNVKCLVSSMRRHFMVLGFALLFMLAAFSHAMAVSQPFMVKDINNVGSGTYSITSSLVTIGSVTYFAAVDDDHGSELWKTDGTEAGTVMVKDICPGSSGSFPDNLTNVNGTLFFTADDGVNGRELWKSDGTADGTVMVKDISPGSMSSNPAYFTNGNGTLFFAADDGVHGRGLWKSDGTAEGTVLVKDITPGGGTSDPLLTNVNGTVFFRAANPVYGLDLWKSDGTAAGTTLVWSVNGYGLQELTSVNGKLFFGVYQQLWVSDGTTAGTVKVADVCYSSYCANPTSLTNVNGTVFFATNWPTVYLWKSDGTASGTVRIKEVAPNNISAPAYLTNVNGTLFFNFMNELWKSDGTSAGTVPVKDQYFNPSDLINVNGTLFFTADDGAVGRELWKSDGTDAGTVLVKDIYPGPGPSYPSSLTNANGTLIFSASDPINGGELWKSDGTPEGTVMVKNIFSGTGGSLPTSLTDVNGTLFFAADDGLNGIGLWKSDGTAAGTALVKDFYTSPGSIRPDNFLNVNGTLFFAADDGVNGRELWKSDGTAAGTVLVKDIFQGAQGAYPSYLTNVAGTLYFMATDQDHGAELWKSDGTADGTVLVKDIYPGMNGSNPNPLTNVNGTLYFTADDGNNGKELWKSDGTADGTVLVKDIYPGAGASYPSYLTNVNGTLYFTANDGTKGAELWKSDGTADGTVLVKDINPGAGSSIPSYLTDVNGTLFFNADDGVNGNELWKSDGTAAGTVMVKDIFPGGSSYPWNLMNVNGTLFFVADDGIHGSELWKSDGTAAGTVMVKDIKPGSGSSNPSGLTMVGNKLYFFADDGVHGPELWTSDGTDAGTVMVMDILPGSGGSMDFYSQTMLNIKGNLFFVANDRLHGYELWALDLTPPVTAISLPTSQEIIAGSTYTIAGSATDALTGVALVEVSTDEGATWNSAVDTSGNGSWSTWSYTWALPTDGYYIIRVRATDKSGNIQDPVTGRGVTVDNYTTSVEGLTVKADGLGLGTVTGPNISCISGAPDDCGSSFSRGTPVTLTATASSGSVFAGWKGQCSEVSGNQCTVVMNVPKSVTATFNMNCGVGPCPEVVASGNIGGAPSINSLGEIVWNQPDQSLPLLQVVSSQRGLLFNDQVSRSGPAINSMSDMVWSEGSGPGTVMLRGTIGGHLVTVATAAWIGNADINDRGEVVWVQHDGSNPDPTSTQIYSNLHGQLTSGSFKDDMPSINNQGDVVFIRRDIQGHRPQVYKLAAGTTAPVAVTNDGLDHDRAAITDSGEIVWTEHDTVNMTPGRIVSSTRGVLFSPPRNIYNVDMNNCGEVAFLDDNNTLYRLGSSEACVTYPAPNDTREQASAVSFGGIFTGVVDVAANPVDWYKFNAAAGDTIHITVNYDNRAPNMLAIGLYDGQGTLISGPTTPSPLGIQVPAKSSGIYYLKMESQGGRFGYTVSLNKHSSNCGAAVCPEVVASGILGWGTAINSLGEVVWSQYDQASGWKQIFSSQRGQLTADPSNHNSPALNNMDDLVWVEASDSYPYTYTLRGIIAGQPVVVATSQNWINKADINDRGEVVWNQPDSNNFSQIFSNVRGQLTSGSVYHDMPSINNQGDIVYTQSDPAQPGPAQVYKLAAGAATPVAVTNDSIDHQYPAINDAGEIVWVAMNSPTGGEQLISSVRGGLVSTAAWFMVTDLNNCGDVVYLVDNNGQTTLYRLGESSPCMAVPARSYLLWVTKSGNGSIVSNPAGINIAASGQSGGAGFAVNSQVTLTATAAAGSVFTAWGGACAGTSGTTCTVTMDQAKGVTAEFALQAAAPSYFTVPANVNSLGNVTVSTGTSSTSGAQYVFQYSSDGGATWATYNSGSVRNPTFTLASGTYLFQVYVVADNYLPSSVRAASNPCVVSNVAIAPALLTVPMTTTGSGTVGISAAASPTPGAQYVFQYSADGVSWTTYNSGSVRNPALTLPAPGTYQFQVYVTAAGYAPSAITAGSNTCTFSGVAVAPALLTVPTTTTGSGAVGISAAASPTPGAQYVFQYSTDGTNWTTYNSGSVRNPALTLPAPGTYRFQVYVTAAGYAPSAIAAGSNTCTFSNVAVAPALLTVPTIAAPAGTVGISAGASLTPGAQYVFQYSADGGATWTTYNSGSVRNPALTLPGPGTYRFQVYVTAPGFVSSPVVAGSTTCTFSNVAMAPANLYIPASTTTGSIYVSAGASLTPGVYYRIQDSTDGGASWTTIYQGAQRNPTLNLGVASGKTYRFQVQTYDPTLPTPLFQPSSWTAGSNTITW